MQELIIEPGRVEKNYWRDLWHYRELFYFLAWRDILVRYKQTVMGIAWAVIQPFLTTVVFTIVFSRIAKLPHPVGVPYSLLVMAAQLPWQFFSSSLSGSSNSLVGNANLISKVYFPRLDCPGRIGHHQFCRPFDHSWADGRNDAVVSIRTRLASSNSAIVRGTRVWSSVRCGTLAVCIKREIPRLPVHYSLHRAIRALPFSRWLQQFNCAGKMAAALLAESDGRRHRWIPLGVASWREHALVARHSDVYDFNLLSLSDWHFLFSQDGTHLCGRDLIMGDDIAISVEGLGKKYRIEHQAQRQQYLALRDVIAYKMTAPLRWLREGKRTSDPPRPIIYYVPRRKIFGR